MTKGEFDILSEKYLSDEINPEELKMLEKWARFHSNADYDVFQNEAESKRISSRLWQRIVTDVEPLVKMKPLWKTNKFWAGLAASVLMAVLCYLYLAPEKRKVSNIKGVETKNITSFRQLTILPDGSAVTLEKDAAIVIDAGYGKKNRTVYLTGEAFFDVKRNPRMPFLIHSGGLATEVLGTSFRIKPQNGDRTIEVIVKTGRVSVYTNNKIDRRKRNGVVITPNQKAVYDALGKTITSNLVDNPEPLETSKIRPDFHFDETRIGDVFAALSKAYGLEILVANESLKQCIFTGNLNKMGLFDQLAAICEVTGAEYEIRGTTVFVSGLSCLDL
ncbi:FecR family protein [Dyadobacter soli]|uniref:FecR family protein n=1 Tax=Dyadobacter soli TaxID=659014 RepID=A0A1G7T7R7_9BACT|nr:FecR family protein [Dyadobacter soli]SDG30650.1 FecR family protein [Dyadobacter soli]